MSTARPGYPIHHDVCSQCGWLNSNISFEIIVATSKIVEKEGKVDIKILRLLLFYVTNWRIYLLKILIMFFFDSSCISDITG